MLRVSNFVNIFAVGLLEERSPTLFRRRVRPRSHGQGEVLAYVDHVRSLMSSGRRCASSSRTMTPSFRSLLRRHLEQDGIKAEEAADGVDVLTRLERPPLPDAVVLDVGMPGEDGLTILQAHPRECGHGRPAGRHADGTADIPRRGLGPGPGRERLRGKALQSGAAAGLAPAPRPQHAGAAWKRAEGEREPRHHGRLARPVRRWSLPPRSCARGTGAGRTSGPPGPISSSPVIWTEISSPCGPRTPSSSWFCCGRRAGFHGPPSSSTGHAADLAVRARPGRGHPVTDRHGAWPPGRHGGGAPLRCRCFATGSARTVELTRNGRYRLPWASRPSWSSARRYRPTLAGYGAGDPLQLLRSTEVWRGWALAHALGLLIFAPPLLAARTRELRAAAATTRRGGAGRRVAVADCRRSPRPIFAQDSYLARIAPSSHSWS